MTILLGFTVAVSQGIPNRTISDFVGLNVHTVLFRPELYRPVAKRLRNYHPYNWDVEDDPALDTPFPKARNGVDWSNLYGPWKKQGFTNLACVMFDQLPPVKWKDIAEQSRRYATKLTESLGNDLEAIEIGNEPGKWPDADYRTLLTSTSRAIKGVNPKLLVSTCATFDKASGDYHKSLEPLKDALGQVDVISVHSYPQQEGWPSWKRSYPEDPRLGWLKDIDAVTAWRDRNAPKKQIWLTEFGWDSSTKTNPPWVGVSDPEQAQYIVRAFLMLSAKKLDRAYLYWFDDKDEPSLHAASGITRNYKPKPSYWSMKQLQDVLGQYQYVRTVQADANGWAIEFRKGSERIWAVWKPEGSGLLRVPNAKSVETQALFEKVAEPQAVRGDLVPVDGNVRYVRFR